jgi:membrane associated rhomboid family serine protease
MRSDDDAVSHTNDSAAPIPVSGGESPRSEPTPDAVLKWIAATGDQPWFPSRHAATTGTDRNDLDGPLGQLRLADLVRVATWIRGVGQGYVLTPEGVALAASGMAVPPASPQLEPKPLVENVEESTPALTPEEQAARLFGLNLRTPVFVPIMLVANVCWFIVGAVMAVRGGDPIGQYLAQGKPPQLLHQIGAVTGTDLLHGEWWRLLSGCFVHFGLLHLLANMFSLAMMGPLAEMLWGRWRLTTIYIFSGLAGSCLAMSNQPDGLLAGASGAIWGILTSLLAWLMLFRSDLRPDVSAEWARRLWIAFLLNAGVSFLPGVSWEGHLGGGIAGFVASGLLNALRFAPRPRRALAFALLLALPVISVGGLLIAMKHSNAWAPLRERARIAAQIAAQIAVDEVYNRDVIPRLNRLSPDVVRPVRLQAWAMLYKQRTSRNPEFASETIAKLTELKATADEVVALLSTTPTGFAPLDTMKTAAQQFAEARAAEMEDLLGMLDSPIPPKDADWVVWGNAHRAADVAWEQLRQK